MPTSLLPLAALLTTALVAACGVDSSSTAAAPSSAGDGGVSAESETTSEPASSPSTAGSAGTALSDDPALRACDAFVAGQSLASDVPGWKTRLPQPPTFTFDEGRDYLWRLETNKGEMVVRLWPEVAPMHVSSTLFLTRAGFYDELTFHRVIPGFMAQGGCPLGNGRGGPGYQYAGEFKPGVSHDRPLLLSTANAGPGTDGSQFFLTFAPTPTLDGKHTLFGEVIEGRETMQALEAAGSRSGRTSEPLVIEAASIEVRAKGAE